MLHFPEVCFLFCIHPEITIILKDIYHGFDMPEDISIFIFMTLGEIQMEALCTR